MASLLRHVPRIRPNGSALFLCDMQEKFRTSVSFFDEVVSNSNRVLRAATLMNVPVRASEQYPKGLGPTVKALGLTDEIKPVAKTQFSMVLPEVMNGLNSSNTRSVILCGIEAHACVQHTSYDLLELGYDVFVATDCCSSRTPLDRKYAFEAMKAAGVILTSAEHVILSFAPNSAHPQFKEIQNLVMKPTLNAGLDQL